MSLFFVFKGLTLEAAEEDGIVGSVDSLARIGGWIAEVELAEEGLTPDRQRSYVLQSPCFTVEVYSPEAPSVMVRSTPEVLG